MRLLLLCIFLLAVVNVASAYEVRIYEVNGTIKTYAEDINETFYDSGTVRVKVLNELNETVKVYVDSKDVQVSDDFFDLSKDESKTIEFTFEDDFEGVFKYTFKVGGDKYYAEQFVTVEVVTTGIDFPKSLNFTVEQYKIAKKVVTFRNVGEATAEVELDYVQTESLISITPSKFSLDPGDIVNVVYTVYGKNGTGYVTVNYRIGDKEGAYVQIVNVKTTPIAEIQEAIKEASKAKEELEALKLEGNVKINVPEEARVGDTVNVRATVDGKPVKIAILLVKYGDYSEAYIVKDGQVSFTPKKAGRVSLTLLNVFGDVVAMKDLNVRRIPYELTLPNARLGEPFTIVLPEKGRIEIKRGGVVVFSGSGSREYNVTLNEMGNYTVRFETDRYYGVSTFKVKGTPSVNIMYGNKVIVAGQEITAGDNLRISATVGSVPVEVIAKVTYPANAFGYSKEDLQMLAFQQMFMQMYLQSTGAKIQSTMMFLPPNNVMVEYRSSGGLMIPIPDSTDGIVTVTLMLEDGTVVGTYSFKVKPKTLLGGYEPIVAIGAATAVLIVAILYRSEKGRGVFIKLRDKLRRKPPEELEA